jgi:hypothetical protein
VLRIERRGVFKRTPLSLAPGWPIPIIGVIVIIIILLYISKYFELWVDMGVGEERMNWIRGSS